MVKDRSIQALIVKSLEFPPIGEGLFSHVYNIQDSRFSDFVIKVNKNAESSIRTADSLTLTEAEVCYPNDWPVERYHNEDGTLQILKKQHGMTIKEFRDNTSLANQHQQIRLFSDKAFVNLVRHIHTLADAGYAVESHASNVMIDAKKREFGLIDIEYVGDASLKAYCVSPASIARTGLCRNASDDAGYAYNETIIDRVISACESVECAMQGSLLDNGFLRLRLGDEHPRINEFIERMEALDEAYLEKQPHIEPFDMRDNLKVLETSQPAEMLERALSYDKGLTFVL